MDLDTMTPAERRKRKEGLRRKEGRRTGRREAKVDEKDGPEVRPKAQEKYAANSTLLFTPSPTTEAPVARTTHFYYLSGSLVNLDANKNMNDRRRQEGTVL
jgi:hypothetical protein